jgi:RluA family pseudouridine synthase
MIFSSKVPSNINAPLPLVEYLTNRFTYYDQTAWNEKITEGCIRIDGVVAAPIDTVFRGQTISYDAGEFEEPPADCTISIIYEDSWLLAVNKPGNLLIHRAGKSFRNNLMYQLRTVHTPPYPSAQSVHRLDRNTSGVVLIAQTADFASKLNRLFLSQNIHKTYIAIVHGIPSPSIESIIYPISKDFTYSTAPKFRIDTAGKKAISQIELCTPLGSAFSKLTLTPHTGRTHQLRVHCAAIGHPIVGDKLYGSNYDISTPLFSNNETGQQLPQYCRHALHCYRLSFMHPWLKTRCTITAPIPEDIQQLEEYLLKDKKKGRYAPL